MLSKFHEILVAYAAAMLVVEPALRLSGVSVAGVVPWGAVPVGSRTGVWCYVAWSVDMSMGRPVNLSHPHRGSVQ